MASPPDPIASPTPGPRDPADTTADALCADPTGSALADASGDAPPPRPMMYLCESDPRLGTPQGKDARAAFAEYRRDNPRTPPDALVLPVYADTLAVAGEPECTVIPEAPATVVQLPSHAQGAPHVTTAPTTTGPTPAAQHPASHAPMGAPRTPVVTSGPAVDAPESADHTTRRHALAAFRHRTLGRILPVVAFAGPRGSGKDAACFALPHAPEGDTPCGHGWVRVALAGELKRRVAFAFGLPWTALVGPSAAREAPYGVHEDWRDRWESVFGPALFSYPWEPRITTPQGAARHLALRGRIAAARERVQAMIAEHLDAHGGTISARLLCQWIGTDFARSVDDATWISRLWCTYAELCRGSGYSAATGVTDAGPCYLPGGFDATRDDLADVPRHYLPAPHDGRSCGAAAIVPRGMVVSDVRFPNEVAAIVRAGPPWLAAPPGGPTSRGEVRAAEDRPAWRHGAVWWLDAEGAPWCPPRMDHASEPTYGDLAGLVTGVIDNHPLPGVPLTPAAPHLAALRERVRGAVGAFVDGLRGPAP